MTIAVYLAFYHSRIGRAWDAITSSPRLAGSVGVDVVRYRMVNILVGSFFIAAAGSFYVIHYHAAIPSVFSFTAGVNTIAYLFIGGFTHSLAGPILGAFIVTFIPEYLQFAQTLQTYHHRGGGHLHTDVPARRTVGTVGRQDQAALRRQTARTERLSMALLEVENLSMSFGKLQALCGFDLTVSEGEIVGLIGPNGAGKTTFFNLVTGTYRGSGGRIVFKGEDITIWRPTRSPNAGSPGRSSRPICSRTPRCSRM